MEVEAVAGPPVKQEAGHVSALQAPVPGPPIKALWGGEELLTRFNWSSERPGEESTATSSTASPPHIATDDEDVETEEAASILSSVLPTRAPAAPPPTQGRSMEYEDLLDCLASVASRRAPIEPLDQRVSRLAVSEGPARRPQVEESSDEEYVPPRRRPRAVSNPEGCDAWRKLEMGAAGRLSTLPERAEEGEGEGDGPTAGGATAPTPAPQLPQMLARYADVYNKNGRIGIYTREERDAIIARFLEKRQRRVWHKKIRYNCRKNLADKRVRFKGRFVRLPKEEEEEAAVNILGSLEAFDARLPPRAPPMEADTTRSDEEGEDETPPRRMRRHSFA